MSNYAIAKPAAIGQNKSMTKVFIESRAPLVEAVTSWLDDHALLTPSGTAALDHILVIVPTRQAGRRLRESLAVHCPSGCIPPRVMLASQFLRQSTTPDCRIPAASEQLALLSRLLLNIELQDFSALFPERGRPQRRTFRWALNQSAQLLEIWRILEEGALSFQCVAQQAETLLTGEDLDIEVARWRDLARIEKLYFDVLLDAQLTPPVLALQNFIAAPTAPSGCTQIMLPALLDAPLALYKSLENIASQLPVTLLIHAGKYSAAGFDDYGRPLPSHWNDSHPPEIDIPDECIAQYADSAAQAAAAAVFFASVQSDEELPALGMADAELYRELHSAFMARNITIHNPAGFPLRHSSLARLVQQLIALSDEAPYSILSALIRQDDIARWCRARLGISAADYASMLLTLDELQNRHLPQNIADVQAFCDVTIKRLAAAEKKYADDTQLLRGAELLKQTIAALLELNATQQPKLSRFEQLTSTLRTLFADRTLSDEFRKDRELSAAARKILEIINELDAASISKALTASQVDILFETMLSNEIYQLEPPPGAVIQCEGWLELPWNPAPEMLITGLNEECVPSTLTGHPFLPDALRCSLGLNCNELKSARDTFILYSLARTRTPGALRLLLERSNAAGDVRKPSRLLFLCRDSLLAQRAARLFSESNRNERSLPGSLPEKWRLKLPIPQPCATPCTISASRIGTYLQCPFTFYLSDILKMRSIDDDALEMEPLAFGNLCHHALEEFGNSPIKDSSDSNEIFTLLRSSIEREISACFGPRPPAVIVLQMSAALERLRQFASIQAQRAADGWMISAVERIASRDFNGVRFKGRLDRIDFNPNLNKVQVIDYKTWNKLGSANKLCERILTTSSIDIEFARQCGYAPFTVELSKGKECVFSDLQLMLYLLMLPDEFKGDSSTVIECGYFVLGDSQKNTLCECLDLSKLRVSALQTINTAAARLQAGIFWPAAPREYWRRDYATLFLKDPYELDPQWIAGQQARQTATKIATDVAVIEGEA
jgi:ATP-dependent helicase/nuclease subunit B